jgi:hypothetical protein
MMRSLVEPFLDFEIRLCVDYFSTPDLSGGDDKSSL